MRALITTTTGPQIGKISQIQLNSKLIQGQLRIAVKSVGLCRTDLAVAKGTIPTLPGLILGHEFSGIVMETCIGSAFKVGDMVAINPLFGKKFMGLHFDGCLRESIVVPESQAYKMNGSLSFKEMAYLEPVAAALAVLNANIPVNIPVGIWGQNRIAELVSIILETQGYLVERIYSDEIASTKFGCYEYLIETSFTQKDVSTIVNLLKEGGTLIVKSRNSSPVSLNMAQFVANDITLKCVSYSDFSKASQWICLHKNKIQHLLGIEYPLSRWKDAFEHAESEQALKIFINPEKED